ncbi:MAG TPA: MarR family transcriptional regulator [Amycolatopsis sp.]|nr:MarR family transcriptional regulator [Amycolatopsis sp.]
MPDEVAEWIERVAAFLTREYGLPPIAGRVLGRLMTCEPPEQTAAQLAEAVGASRASLTTNLRLLIGAGLVGKRAGRGERAAIYRVDDDAWQRVIRRRVAMLGSFRDITREGIELLERDGGRASRVRSADAAFAWLAEAVRETGPQP